MTFFLYYLALWFFPGVFGCILLAMLEKDKGLQIKDLLPMLVAILLLGIIVILIAIGEYLSKYEDRYIIKPQKDKEET